MKLVISTPCFGGQLFRGYAGALMQAKELAVAEGLLTECHILWQGSESLIPRARNRDAMYLLESGFDKLLSIDADIEFSYEDFKRIITSEKDIVGGIYPIKSFPVVANFNPLPAQRAKYFKSNRGMDLLALEEFARECADPETGEAEVYHVPTGFMCVTQKVFAALSHTVDVYRTFDPSRGEVKGFFEFYPVGVRGEEYLSEDWYFCRLAAEAGFPIYVNTKVRLGHAGLHVYKLGQVYGEV